MSSADMYVDVVRSAILSPNSVIPPGEGFEPRSKREAHAVLHVLLSRGWTPPDPMYPPVGPPIYDEERFQEVLDHLNGPGEYRDV